MLEVKIRRNSTKGIRKNFHSEMLNDGERRSEIYEMIRRDERVLKCLHFFVDKIFLKTFCQHCFEINKFLIQQICASHGLVFECGGELFNFFFRLEDVLKIIKRFKVQNK